MIFAERILLLVLASWILSYPAKANAILEWNALAIDAIRLDNSAPTLSTRNLAILHTAIYDAVNSVSKQYQPYRFDEAVSTDTSDEAAAVSAAHLIMKSLYPGMNGRADQMYAEYLARTLHNHALTNGLKLGEEIAQEMLESRSTDGANVNVPYIPSEQPGAWRRTPPFFRPPTDPQWRYLELFALPEMERFMSPPPPSLASAEYAESVNEVRLLGSKGSLARTAEQKQIAIFWSDFSYTAMPPGHWHLIAATIAVNRQTTLIETARLFALLSLAQADAGIVCWEAKYRFNLWRPITSELALLKLLCPLV